MICAISDKDHNGIVTMEEFAALPPGEVDDQWKDSDKLWQEERRKEFKDVIDLNKDGKVTREELMVGREVPGSRSHTVSIQEVQNPNLDV